jgi:hypothetical protein
LRTWMHERRVNKTGNNSILMLVISKVTSLTLQFLR